MARTAVQATLDKIENLFESPKDIEAETETVTNNLVMGIKTPLNTMSIALQDSRESNQENLSGHMDSTTPLSNKGKARESTPQNHETKDFNKWMKTPIGTARVYKTPLIVLLRLPGENQEQYIAHITAQQAKRGYLRSKRSKTKGEIPKEKWQ